MTKRISLNSSRIKEKKNESIVCGIDEAGRGPLLGPMVICGICFYESDLPKLIELGVKDSKKLTATKRKDISTKLKELCLSYKSIAVSPQEIDQRLIKRITLNELEVLKMAKIINKLKPSIIYIDAADVKEKRFEKSIKTLLSYEPEEIIAKHKADDLFPVVGAASIIAKHQRDTQIEEFKKKFGNIGSGYPSDGISIEFLRAYIRKNKKIPHFVRKSWAPAKKIISEELKTRKITDFF